MTFSRAVYVGLFSRYRSRKRKGIASAAFRLRATQATVSLGRTRAKAATLAVASSLFVSSLKIRYRSRQARLSISMPVLSGSQGHATRYFAVLFARQNQARQERQRITGHESPLIRMDTLSSPAESMFIYNPRNCNSAILLRGQFREHSFPGVKLPHFDE